MTRRDECRQEKSSTISRRTLVTAITVGAGGAVVGSRRAIAQAERAAPPSTVTSLPRDFGPNGAPTTYFWDPDIVAVDPLFNRYAQPNSAITRLWTGSLWGEGPAWNAQGRYLVWSESPTTASCAGSKLFIDFIVDGVKCGPDGARCDVDGNLWCSSNAGRAVGYSGVTVWTPEVSPRRNRLFMAASQSLYAIHVSTQGASPG